MTLELPQPPSVDESRAGLLSIVPFMIGHLLRLPKGQEVIEARIARSGTIELRVCGEGMPAIEAGGEPVFVTLFFQREVRDGDTGTKQERTLAYWEHDPDQKWVVHDWSAA